MTLSPGNRETSTVRPDVEGRLTEGSRRPARWLHAPSSMGTG